MVIRHLRRLRQTVLLREISRLNGEVERLNAQGQSMATVIRALAIHRSKGRSFTIVPPTVERSVGYDVTARDVDGGIRIEVERRQDHG